MIGACNDASDEAPELPSDRFVVYTTDRYWVDEGGRNTWQWHTDGVDIFYDMYDNHLGMFLLNKSMIERDVEGIGSLNG